MIPQKVIQIDPGHQVPLHVDTDGNVRVAGTRLTLDTLIGAYHRGSTVDDLCEQFPGVAPRDYQACIDYYLSHQAELDEYLLANEAEAAEIERQITSTPEYQQMMADLKRRFANHMRETGEG